jgi:hypothetical protein
VLSRGRAQEPPEPDSTRNPLGRAVRELVERVRPWVLLWPDVGPADGDRVTALLRDEARRIAAAFVAADGRLDVDELMAFRASFGATDPELARARFDDLRDGDLVRRDAEFTREPSVLFDALARHDREHGTAGAWTYYEAALGVAHAACASGTVNEAELAAIDAYRAQMLAVLRGGPDRPRPGAPAARAAGEGTATLDWSDPDALGGLPGEPPEAAPALDDLLDELDALVGLDAVKQEVHRIVNLTRVERMRAQHGLPVADRSRHLVFVGNPGTGKTTVARLLSRLYHALGTLARGHLVETDRAGLVAGYVGQTATRVTEVVERAIGGTLFIDEAYALDAGGGQDFGPEAVATLLKLMEDRRTELVVVIAGYPAPMASLLDSNPGLRSRFPKTITFPDYSTDELVEIFGRLAQAQGYDPAPGALDAVRAVIDAVPRTASFGNGRLARNLLEEAIARHADRVVRLDRATTDELRTLVAADVPPPA